jgi:predicted nucleic acid-binding protein
MGERRRRSTEAQAVKWLTSLSSLPIAIDHETTTRAWTDTLNLARKYELSAYDAAYLELALRLGLEIATLDDKLKEAADQVGVPIFQP